MNSFTKFRMYPITKSFLKKIKRLEKVTGLMCLTKEEDLKGGKVVLLDPVCSSVWRSVYYTFYDSGYVRRVVVDYRNGVYRTTLNSCSYRYSNNRTYIAANLHEQYSIVFLAVYRYREYMEGRV